jgi:hypothetical protein
MRWSATLFSRDFGDSSRNVTANATPSDGATEGASATLPKTTSAADDALRLAILRAVECGDYDRAAALLEIARRSNLPRP